MYRTGKPFHGSARWFFYLVIHVLSTRFLLGVEGVQSSPSQREIEEAQKTVGRFLGNGTGTTWLSNLAKNRSSPLTTEDIINAILRKTKPEGRVWKAASVLSEALNSKTLEGLPSESIIGQSYNWKDIIAGVEKEDDIICLYRKNTEESAKKSEDWQKFLKTLSPGYTVHFAIDTGVKYIICLKKINVPEAMPNFDVSSSPATTLISESSTSVAEDTSTVPMTLTESPVTIPSSAMKKHSSHNKSDSNSDEEDMWWSDEVLEDAEDNGHETMEVDNENTSQENFENENLKGDDEDNSSLDNSFENENMEETGLMKDFSEESEDYKVSTELGRRRMITSPTGLQRFNSKNTNQPSYPSILVSEGRDGFIPEASKRDLQCERPIILVVQPGSSPLPLRLPVQNRMVSSLMTSIPRTPVMVSGWHRQPLNSVGSAINYPQVMRTNNLGKFTQGYSTFMRERLPLQNFPRNTNFAYKLQSEKTRLGKSMEKSILEKNRNTIDPKILYKESKVVQRRPNVVMPRRVEVPVSHTRGTTLPFDRQPVLAQWPQKAKDIVIPRTGIPDRSNLVRYNFLSRLEQERKAYILRQLMINQLKSRTTPQRSIYKPIVNSALSRSIQPFTVQSSQPLIFDRSPGQKTFKVNQGLPVQPVQNIDRTNPRPINVLNYPSANNLIEPRQRQSMTNPFNSVIHRSPIYESTIFDGIRGNGGCVKDPADQFQPYPVSCQSPCDRPIRLQIVIQGDVKTPSKFTVPTEPGERVEIFGSGNPVLPYGPRSDTSGTLVRGALGEAEKKIQPEVVEVEQRMDNSTNEETEKHIENDDETFAIEDKSVESEESSTLATGNETISDKVETKKIGERFLDETTIETTFSPETNWTTFAITNSTLIV